MTIGIPRFGHPARQRRSIETVTIGLAAPLPLFPSRLSSCVVRAGLQQRGTAFLGVPGRSGRAALSILTCKEVADEADEHVLNPPAKILPDLEAGPSVKPASLFPLDMQGRAPL